MRELSEKAFPLFEQMVDLRPQVGFISIIPNHMICSFHLTLEGPLSRLSKVDLRLFQATGAQAFSLSFRVGRDADRNVEEGFERFLEE